MGRIRGYAVLTFCAKRKLVNGVRLRIFVRFALVLALAATTLGLASPASALTISKTVLVPKALTATVGSQTVQLRWTKVVSTSKVKVTGYQVTAMSGTWRKTATVSAAASTYRFSALTNNKTYRFVVQTVSGRLASSAVGVFATPRRALLSNSIEFAQPSDMFLGGEDQQLSALTNGADAVFESLSPSICSVTGDKVHAVAIGDCTIRATSPASGLYAAATPVERLLSIAPAPTPLNKVLLWSDEFDGPSASAPSSSNWRADVSDGCGAPYNNCGWGNAERQYYTTEANRVDGSADGVLNISATKQTSKTNLNCYYGRCEWLSGKITTYGKKSFGYGYMEARIKVPTGQGAWPAFWMLGTDIATNPWPACGEIDIMEYKGGIPTVTYGTVHYASASGSHLMLGGTKDTMVDLSAGYHRYAMLWKPTEITFFIDDLVVYTARKADAGSAPWRFSSADVANPPRFYLILNLAMGGNFGGAVDESVESATLSVDWVRFYSVDGVGKVFNN